MSLHFEDLIRDRTINLKPPGVIFGKVSQFGTEYFSYGVNSLDEAQAPNSATFFEIGSNTKVFTALLCARLEELGFFSLNDPIRDYLPSSISIPERAGRQISFRDLLTHTSALPPMPANFDFQNAAKSFAAFSAEDLYTCLEQLSLDWDIGQSYVYSNLGYGLLGDIVEKVTGESWHELLTKHICEPLGMSNTGVEISAQHKNIATAHQGARPVTHLTFDVLAAAGALRSTAQDMTTFLSHSLGFCESELSPAIKKAGEIHYRESAIFSLGLGWHIQQRDQNRLVWHRGETFGQTSFIVFDPDAETGIVMLSNSAFSGCCSDIAVAQLDSSLTLAEQEPHAVLDVPTTQLERYTGEFALDPAISFFISVEQSCLSIRVTGQPGGKMNPVALHQFETQDRRVIVKYADDLKTITIRQHGIDRKADFQSR